MKKETRDFLIEAAVVIFLVALFFAWALFFFPNTDCCQNLRNVDLTDEVVLPPLGQ